MQRRLLSTIVLGIGLTLTGCSKPSVVSQTTPTQEATMPTTTSALDRTHLQPPTPAEITSYDQEAKTELARIVTAKGTIEFEFYPDEAPVTVANFIKLTKQGFYNGLTFHRVVPDFVIQGGDPNGDGTGGPGYQIKAEFNSHKHLTGTVAMARSADPNSAGSQFYITLAPQPSLDGQYTVFGQVTSGLDVLPQIQQGDVIQKIELTPKTAK